MTAFNRRWSGVLARLGYPTGDRRIIAPGGGSSRDLPLPLMYQQRTEDGHGGAVVVGAIDTLSIGDGMVTATGHMLDAAYGTDVMELLEAGVVGPSVDLDDIEYVMDDAENLVITKWRIAGATLVAIPAFEGVSVNLDPMPAPDDEDEDEDEGEGEGEGEDDETPKGFPVLVDVPAFTSLTSFSVRTSGWSDMPIADESRAWDGDAAADRVFAWAGGEDNISWSKYARAFLRKDDSANPETRGAYGFGIADVIDGTLTIVPRGVFAAAAAVQGARTGSAPEDAEGMKRVLRSLYARMDREAPFSLAASAAPVQPPADWFKDPGLAELTPLTVAPADAQGRVRVFGHIAGWGSCHIGLPGCVTPPTSWAGYSYFHVAEQAVEGGFTLPVGTLVAGPRHADAQLAFQAAQQHYDDPDAAVARVVAGEDEHGIWVAGWLIPGAVDKAVDIFRTSPVSGDWRRVGGHLELIAVCSVNAPGFPVPRARVAFSGGAQRTLVGAFGITPVAGVPSDSFVRQTDGEGRARWAWAQTGMED